MLKGSWILKVLAGIVVVLYLGVVSFSAYRYLHVGVNERPWRGGIYEAYYECAKCGSLDGGIYGKGPTRRRITDPRCVHDWQAIYRGDFDRKFGGSGTT